MDLSLKGHGDSRKKHVVWFHANLHGAFGLRLHHHREPHAAHRRAPRMTRRKFESAGYIHSLKGICLYIYTYTYIYIYIPLLVLKGIEFAIFSHCFQGAQKQMEG